MHRTITSTESSSKSHQVQSFANIVHMAILCYLQHLEDSKDCEQLHLNLLFTCLPLFTATMKLMAEAPDEIKKRDNKAVEFVINIMKMFKIAIKMHRFSGLFHQ